MGAGERAVALLLEAVASGYSGFCLKDVDERCGTQRGSAIVASDPLNPIQGWGNSTHDEMLDFQGVPSVGAGLRNPE